MKVYVAAPGVIKEKAKKAMDHVRAEGHEITFDWIANENFRPHWRDHREEGRIHAEKEREGAVTCAVLILIMPPKELLDRGLGCFIEFGMSAGNYRTLWIIDYEDYSRDSIFYCLNDVHFLTWESMIEALKMARDTELANEAELDSMLMDRYQQG